MKIAFIGSLPPASVLPAEALRSRRGGGEHPAPWIQALLPALARYPDLQCRAFLVHRHIRRHEVVEREGLEYEGIPFPFPERFNLWHRFRLQSLLLTPAVRRYRPDLVHAFGLETGNATKALHSEFPVSCFIQGIVEHLAPFYDLSTFPLWQKRRMESIAVRGVVAFVAENQFAASWARRHNARATIRIIPHPLRQEFLNASPAEYGAQIVSVGGLDRRKGMDTLIAAFARLTDTALRLCIIGSGPLRVVLEGQARNLGVAERVRFAGVLKADAIISELRRSRLFVMASRMDTSPNALSEAHAVGLPVIGTQVGGIPEMIDDGVDGCLVPVDDVAAMAQAMDRLWRDPDLCSQMGGAGREKVRELNDPRRIANEHYLFFRELMERLKEHNSPCQ